MSVRFGYARGTFRPEIAAEVEAFLKTDEGRSLAVARPSAGPDYTSFACRHCGTLFDPLWARRQFEKAYDDGRLVAGLKTTTAQREPVSQPLAHWCYPLEGAFCTT